MGSRNLKPQNVFARRKLQTQFATLTYYCVWGTVASYVTILLIKNSQFVLKCLIQVLKSTRSVLRNPLKSLILIGNYLIAEEFLFTGRKCAS